MERPGLSFVHTKIISWHEFRNCISHILSGIFSLDLYLILITANVYMTQFSRLGKNQKNCISNCLVGYHWILFLYSYPKAGNDDNANLNCGLWDFIPWYADDVSGICDPDRLTIPGLGSRDTVFALNAYRGHLE